MKYSEKQIREMVENYNWFEKMRKEASNKYLKTSWENNKNPIDAGILDLITDLNEAGFYTYACCQGKTSLKEFLTYQPHTPAAYISFFKTIPRKIQSKLKQAGIILYDENSAISSIRVKKEEAELSEKEKQEMIYHRIKFKEAGLIQKKYTKVELSAKEKQKIIYYKYKSLPFFDAASQKKIIAANIAFQKNVRKAFLA